MLREGHLNEGHRFIQLLVLKPMNKMSCRLKSNPISHVKVVAYVNTCVTGKIQSENVRLAPCSLGLRDVKCKYLLCDQ